FGIAALSVLGLDLMAMDVPAVLEAFGRFTLQGLGAPALVLPARHLMITGFYRHVRNRLYLAVVAIILGQGLVFGHAGLLVYGAAFWLGFHLFVLAYEEPTLRRTFAAEYDTYCANVPRWLPRRRPWAPTAP